MGRKKIITIKKCSVCGKDFETGRHREKITCSKECFRKYQEIHKEERIQKSTEGVIKKYGVDHVSKIEGFSKKVKQTKKKKYGDENYSNREKAKETLMEKYGVDNSMKLEVTQKKSKATKKEKYGDENFNNREKAEKTTLEKTGKHHHLQTEDSLQKLRETNKKRYDVEYTIRTPKSKENLKKHNLEKYNSEYFFSSQEHLTKMSEEKKEKIKKIMQEHGLEFDVDSYERLRRKSGKKLNYIKYEVKCKKCGHIFKTSFINKPIVCRKCYPIKKSSSIIQAELRELLNENKIDFTENNRDIIKPLELDFYFSDIKMAIELNGNYWHSELSGKKNKKYHLNKTIECSKKGIKLIHIFEDEWLLKKDIVKSRLLNLFKKTTEKIYARQCVVREIGSDEKNAFIENHHIQGNSVDKIRIGLFYNESIVSVMTFSNNRKALGKNSEEGCFELNRFCSKLNSVVVGGFEKMMSHFIKTYNPKEINTYADVRWSGIVAENTVYFKNKFRFMGITPPSYFYMYKTDYLHRTHRFAMAKFILLEKYGGLASQTGWEIAQLNGFDRIWDCGCLKFQLKL